MGYRNREKEVKLAVTGASYKEVCKGLRRLYRGKYIHEESGNSTDLYWPVRDSAVGADFVRVRDRGDGSYEITSKGRDKGPDSIDRIEVDIVTSTRLPTVVTLLDTILGKNCGTIRKKYYVLWLSERENISVYQVRGAPGVVYVEAESTSNSRVLELEAQVIQEINRYGGSRAERAEGSLYEMYIVPISHIPSRGK